MGARLSTLLAVLTVALSVQAHAAPDFSGVWWPEGEGSALRADGGDVPLTAEGRAAWERNKAVLATVSSREKNLNDLSKCTPAGIPRLMLEPYPFRIVQTDKVAAIFFERGYVYQIAHFTQTRPDYVSPGYAYMGHSIARFSGETLILDVTGFNGETMLDGAGLPHGENLQVTEKFTRTGPAAMDVEFTITDPDFYTKPWTARRSYTLRSDMEIEEYICGLGAFETRYTRGAAR